MPKPKNKQNEEEVKEPKKTKTSKKDKVMTVSDSEMKTIKSQYETDFDNMAVLHEEFIDRENVLMGLPLEGEENKEDYVDPTLQTALFKQNNQTMAQLPTGKVDFISGEFKGQALLMDLILHKYIIPNANTQYDVFTKFWLTSLYRKVYGAFGVLTFYNVTGEYVGPDFSLIPARSMIFQSGRYTVPDSDYIYIRSVVTRDWLKKKSKKTWTNIDKILKETKSKDLDNDYSTANEEKYSNVESNQIELVTKYSRKKWITFNPATSLVARVVKGNGYIPVDVCYSFPLADRIFGLGDVERGEKTHRKQNEIVNLYFKAVKMSIAPPVKIDLSGVVPKTIKNVPGAKWIIRNGSMNAVQEVPRSPLGLNSFQQTSGMLKGNILTITNSTDTSVSKEVDPGMGKTPQALKMQEQTETIKTSFDKKMLELVITGIYDKMIRLTTSKQVKPMKFNLLKEEIDKLAETYPEIKDLWNEETGEMIIKPEKIKDAKYKFIIDLNSTVLKDNMVEHETLDILIDKLTKFPTFSKQIEESGEFMMGDKKLVFSELVKSWMMTSGSSNLDKILVDNERQDQQKEIVNEIQTKQGMEAMMQPGMMPPSMPGMAPPAMPGMAGPLPPMAPPLPGPTPGLAPAPAPSPINFENDLELQEIINSI